MAKRFTETAKWDDPFFQDLPPKYKCFWIFILDKCDAAGIWNVNFRAAEFFIGEKIDVKQAIELFKERIFILNGGERWFIQKFISFQYGELTEKCRPHLAVIQILKKYNLFEGYSKGIVTLKDKEQDKEQDKDKTKTPEKNLSLVPNSFEDFKNEMLIESEWYDNAAMACKIEPDKIIGFLEQYIKDRKADGDWQKSYSDHKKHFRNYVNKVKDGRAIKRPDPTNNVGSQADHEAETLRGK
jgi:hypothetical protein